MSFGERLREARKNKKLTQKELASLIHAAHNSISNWENDQNRPDPDIIQNLCWALDVTPNYLLSEGIRGANDKFRDVDVTDDYVEIPILGDLAAGYDHLAVEDWTGETIAMPRPLLHGRKREDYFALRVKGDSMYPHFMENDVVVVLKQETMDYSGQVGVVLYDGELATLKKVEYVKGEDWVRLVPINPQFKPVTITGEDLENCHVIGVANLLIRDLEA